MTRASEAVSGEYEDMFAGLVDSRWCDGGGCKADDEGDDEGANVVGDFSLDDEAVDADADDEAVENVIGEVSLEYPG